MGIDYRPEDRPGDEDRADERHGGRGQIRLTTSRVEVGETGSDPLSSFTQDELGDDVAADDKEDVDPDKASLETPNAGVIGDDEQHRDRTQTLDVAVQMAAPPQRRTDPLPV